MDKDLKPCPFCGEHGKPYFKTEKVFEHICGKEMTMYSIECGECLLATPFRNPDKDALKNWWNTRAQVSEGTPTDCPAVDVEDIQALRDAVKMLIHSDQELGACVTKEVK